jgi:HEAT repeat protein
MNTENQQTPMLEKPLLDSIEAIKKWQYGSPEGDLSLVRRAVLDSPPGSANADLVAQALIPILQSDATKDAKEFVCRQLMMLNSESAVAPLSRLLYQDELAEMALYALESLSSPAVKKNLLEELSKTTGKLLLGIILVQGRKKVHRAVALLTGKLQDPDRGVQSAAIKALGMIGDLDAVKALMPLWNQADETLRMTLGDALLSCAESLKNANEPNPATRLLNILGQENAPPVIRKAALKQLQSS